MKRLIFVFTIICASFAAAAQSVRLDEGWKFALGNAASPEKDFGCGTEYFNYLTKAASIHNEGPYSMDFDDSAWESVNVPHDWVTTLPYSPDASKSHGYKTVGWKYPETSVGWYRRHISIPAGREGRHFELRLDGVFRNANVWFNGIYMGTEPSGYAVQTYDITPYIDFGGDNVLCIRADASLEEGWFYEGAGIYRPVYLVETGKEFIPQGGIWTEWDGGVLSVFTEGNASAIHRLRDAEGEVVACGSRMSIDNPHLWSPDNTYLYTLETIVGEDKYITPVGLRTAEFNAEEGFLLNGKKLILKGVNLHQDHAGVGSALPDGLIKWRLRKMKELGVNAIRSSHNPASPKFLDYCDSLGLLVIDENRLMGINAHHKRLLENMVRWGRQHPSVILWSMGNEEWGLENRTQGARIVREMQEYVRGLDPTRRTTAGNSGGAALIEGLDVHGYNYIVQNDVEGRHESHPEWIIYGSEETSGCGTRGIYYPEEGRMPAYNRGTRHGVENVIERGWKFYHENQWAAGLFYWTGFDYRGEPDPLVYPAHDSEFGILDYCGFPKDEAWYLRAWWKDEPVMHVFPHWNLHGHEGKTVEIWAYSNCDEVSLTVNGRSLGKKTMPRDGHLKWDAVYKPGKIVATGYNNGRKVLQEVIETTGAAADVILTEEVEGDIHVFEATVVDSKGRTVPDARIPLTFILEGEGRIIGMGNGDPACPLTDHPANEKTCTFPSFGGKAQVIVQSKSSTCKHMRVLW